MCVTLWLYYLSLQGMPMHKMAHYTNIEKLAVANYRNNL